jgi:serine/threonine protein kinase
MVSEEVRSFLNDQCEGFNFSLFYKIQIEIGKLLGEGGSGKVYYGQRISGAIPNQVALKSTKHNNKEDDFKKEIILLKQMDHLYIVKFY